MENKVVYDTKQVAELLDVASSTVRKYCDYLEKSGYDFHKNEHGHRGFFDHDVIVFRKLIEYKRAMSLEKATNAVMAWEKGNDIAPPDTPNPHH
ncbi:DNA-binding protein, partial [Aquibacillus koreensis]|nr:DNA-binding protein [Aquibacillus koreensis]